MAGSDNIRLASGWLISPILLFSIIFSGGAYGDEQPHILVKKPATLPVSLGQSHSVLAQAERAFVNKQYQRTIELATQIDDHDLLAARARYIEGYAHYKLGDLEQAARVLKRSLTLAATPEVSFLNGLVAFELHRWQDAINFFEPLVLSPKEPWTGTAQTLIDRARSKSIEEQRVNAHNRHAKAIKRAKAHLEARQFTKANQALIQAEEAIPGHLLTHYYRGYLSYEQGDEAKAKRYFSRALLINPQDPWSKYMLALCLDDSAPEKKILFKQLAATSSDSTIREEARRALVVQPKPSSNVLLLQAEFNTGYDTNPAYTAIREGDISNINKIQPPIDNNQFPSPSKETSSSTTAIDSMNSAMALGGKLDFIYQRTFTPTHQGAVGVRLFEQDYLTEGESQAKTDIAGWIGYSFDHRRIAIMASYDYTLNLLSHDPLMSLHEIRLKIAFPLRFWLEVENTAEFLNRDIHNQNFQYLEALELSEAMALKGEWKKLMLRAGYHLARSWSNPTEIIVAQSNFQPNIPSTSTIYRTDYTFLAHGPRLELEISLPWRLTFNAMGWVLWYDYDYPDHFYVRTNYLTMNSVSRVTWEQHRHDLQILAGAELKRPLKHGLEIGIHFSSVDNLSSLDSSTPVNKSYSHRLVSGLIRWRWPIY